MKKIEVQYLKEAAGVEKGFKKWLPLQLAKRVEKEGIVKLIGEPVEVVKEKRMLKLKSKAPEKVETKKAPTRRPAKKG